MTMLNGKFNDQISSGVQMLNPFVHKLELDNPFDKIKTAVLTVLLLPFRVICICCLLVIAWMLACIGLYGLSMQDLRTKPMTGWRRALKYVICMVGRWSYLAGGMAITVKGRQASRRDAAILVLAPHSTFLDSVIVYVTNMCSVIVRKESMDNYAGKLINYTQPIYVWRDDPNSRQNTIKNIIERANSDEDWPQIIIFPEGTCTNRSCLITFKPGAFYPGVPVQPVCIRYPNKLDTVTWTWEGPGVLKLLWLTLTQVHSHCEIEFLPVYVPNEEEKQNPKLFARNVRNVMAKSLGVPVSDYTYDDCKMITRAKQLNIPNATDIVEVEKLRQKIGLDQTNIEEQILKALLVNNANHNITLSEFALRLQISAQNMATVQLFSLFDKDDSGTIDFREYLLCALFFIKTDLTIIEMMHLVAMMYEITDTGLGQLSREALYSVVRYTLAMSHEECDTIFSQIDTTNKKFITFSELRHYLNLKSEFVYVFQSTEPEEQSKLKRQ